VLSYGESLASPHDTTHAAVCFNIVIRVVVLSFSDYILRASFIPDLILNDTRMIKQYEYSFKESQKKTSYISSFSLLRNLHN
jgi:hypothetical protein